MGDRPARANTAGAGPRFAPADGGPGHGYGGPAAVVEVHGVSVIIVEARAQAPVSRAGPAAPPAAEAPATQATPAATPRFCLSETTPAAVAAAVAQAPGPAADATPTATGAANPAPATNAGPVRAIAAALLIPAVTSVATVSRAALPVGAALPIVPPLSAATEAPHGHAAASGAGTGPQAAPLPEGEPVAPAPQQPPAVVPAQPWLPDLLAPATDWTAEPLLSLQQLLPPADAGRGLLARLLRSPWLPAAAAALAAAELYRRWRRLQARSLAPAPDLPPSAGPSVLE